MKTQYKVKVNIDVTAESIMEATDKVNTILYNALQDHKKTVWAIDDYKLIDIEEDSF